MPCLSVYAILSLFYAYKALALLCKSMGNTPYRYLIEYRLQKAMGLLTGSALSVGEIAQAVGFHSQSHFGRLFKARTVYAPKDYRRGSRAKRP